MIKPGHIEIVDNEFVFVYHELEKPNYNDYGKVGYYQLDLEKYLASKRSVEVSNVLPRLLPRLNEQKVDIYYDVIFDRNNFEQIKNNQPCKAEVNGKATIVELIK